MSQTVLAGLNESRWKMEPKIGTISHSNTHIDSLTGSRSYPKCTKHFQINSISNTVMKLMSFIANLNTNYAEALLIK
jgi:hypothetical protein